MLPFLGLWSVHADFFSRGESYVTHASDRPFARHPENTVSWMISNYLLPISHPWSYSRCFISPFHCGRPNFQILLFLDCSLLISYSYHRSILPQGYFLHMHFWHAYVNETFISSLYSISNFPIHPLLCPHIDFSLPFRYTLSDKACFCAQIFLNPLSMHSFRMLWKYGGKFKSIIHIVSEIKINFQWRYICVDKCNDIHI